jgi:hypothetical protein
MFISYRIYEALGGVIKRERMHISTLSSKEVIFEE